ncbi:MAG: ATP-binding protein [Proteobacteria bacterium]|nr:ATP-binding protein [Pseudomonadota bacterium]
MQKKLSLAKDTLEFVEDLKRRWMSTVDAIIDPLMLIDNNFNVLQANRATGSLAHQDVKEVIEQKCYKIFASRSSPCPGCRLLESIEAKKPLNFELNQVYAGRTYEVNTQPIYNSQGEFEGSLHIYRDRTLAKQMQNQLIQHEKLASIGLLAGGIAHEINNPLAGILLFSQMLLRTMDKDSSHYQDVIEIESAAKRCKAIVESLLDFARKQPVIDDKKSSVLVDLQDAMESALRFSTVGGAADRLEIVEEWSKNRVQTNGNRNKFIQVFLNLIQNAIQAMPNGGTLTLRTFEIDDENGQWAVAEVIDTGIGIPSENLKKIFDPFFTSKGEGQGTGLGLSICHGIINDLCGDIEVKSKLNQGSSFRIIVPRARANQQAG